MYLLRPDLIILIGISLFHWYEQLAATYPIFVKMIERHSSDAIMVAMASQITSLTIVYSTVDSGADQRKHQSSASPVTGEFPAQIANNADMTSSWEHSTPCVMIKRSERRTAQFISRYVFLWLLKCHLIQLAWIQIGTASLLHQETYIVFATKRVSSYGESKW